MASTVAKRNPDETRQALIEAAFEEMYQQGFRAASLGNILSRTGVTKGALYHHFPNKTALGYAVVEELIYPRAKEFWGLINDETLHPVDALVKTLESKKYTHTKEQLECGCPINNLVQEMSTVDEGFRERLSKIMLTWRTGIQNALERGQANGQVVNNIDPAEIATMLVASFEGCASLAKCSRSADVFYGCIDSMIGFVKTLRVDSQ
ncbi:MAG: TetR/AcrR family transcriptional regulator [Gammaproteobacteria bacterium]|nr:TetR/AcrR family transcriptional regulator [Gammaproteobacteria bacterium]